MNNKRTKWIIPVAVIGFFALAIVGWVTFFNLIKQKSNDSLATVTSEESVDDSLAMATSDESADDTSIIDTADDISPVYGGWESESYYEFREDGTYGWYKSSNDLSDNYYSGTYTVIKGYDACEHLGISFDKILDVMINSEGQVLLNDIYCITCTPTYLVSGGVDKSDTLSGISYDMLFVVTGEKSAQGMLVSNYDTYYFTKIK